MAKNKRHISRKPADIAKYKARFLARLGKGRAPANAAEDIGIARGTAYKWRQNDPEFDAAWVEAIDIGVDRVETKVYSSAMRGNMVAAMFILKHRRREVFGDTNSATPNNLVVNITLEEHTRRLERMGLPVPRLETDYDEDDKPGVIDVAATTDS